MEEEILKLHEQISCFILSDNAIDYVKERLLLDLELGETERVSNYLEALKMMVTRYEVLSRTVDWLATEWSESQKSLVDAWDKDYDLLCSEIINS